MDPDILCPAHANDEDLINVTAEVISGLRPARPSAKSARQPESSAMTYLLGAAGRAALRDFVTPRTLLAFDYDGTLAPQQRASIEAFLTPQTHDLFGALCQRYPCAVVSGRGLADLRSRLAGLGPCTLVGNHGMEPDDGKLAGAGWAIAVKRWTKQLQGKLRGWAGVSVEAKRYSLSVHWRGAPNTRGLTSRVLKAASELTGVRFIPGKQVLNVLPANAPNKGDALRYALRKQRCVQGLFAGDDVTDEDGFALASTESVLGVRVGPSRTTQARFYLKAQREMDPLLEALLQLNNR